MDQKLLDEIQKKDSDAEIVETTSTGYIIKTTLDLGSPLPEEVGEESLIFPHINASIRIVRHTFVCLALISFIISLYGIVPLYLLLKDYIISISLLCSSLFMSVLFYVFLFLVENTKWGLPTFIMYIFNIYIVLCSLAGVLHSLAPFQGCLILFIECLSIILLGFCFKDNVKVNYAIFTMMGSGLIFWGVGIFAFLTENDWISSGVLFILCIVAFPLYAGLQIHRINSNLYHTKEVDRVLIRFITDPIGIPIEYIKLSFYSYFFVNYSCCMRFTNIIFSSQFGFCYFACFKF